MNIHLWRRFGQGKNKKNNENKFFITAYNTFDSNDG